METPPLQKTLTSNELAAIRTELSGERTLMAWTRTSLGLISFGFSFHKFMRALPGNRGDHSPRFLGIFLAAMGTMSLLAGTIQYVRVLRSFEARRLGFMFYFACAALALGLLVLVGLILKIGPFA
jgi:putative membrane protein